MFMVISGTKYWYIVSACLWHLLDQVCKENDFTLGRVTWMMIFSFLNYLAYIQLLFLAVYQFLYCVQCYYGLVNQVWLLVQELEIRFISSIRLLCRSWLVENDDIYFSSASTKYEDIIEGQWNWERCIASHAHNSPTFWFLFLKIQWK